MRHGMLGGATATALTALALGLALVPPLHASPESRAATQMPAAPPPTASSQPRQEDVAQALRTAPFYAWGAVGTPATVSIQEQAARHAHRAVATGRLLAALPHATPEGQMYLLCLLRRREGAAYAQAKRQVALSVDRRVSTLEGNVLRKERALDIVAQLERGRCAPLDWPEAAGEGAAPPASGSR